MATTDEYIFWSGVLDPISDEAPNLRRCPHCEGRLRLDEDATLVRSETTNGLGHTSATCKMLVYWSYCLNDGATTEPPPGSGTPLYWNTPGVSWTTPARTWATTTI